MKSKLKFMALFLAGLTVFSATVFAGTIEGVLSDLNESKKAVVVETSDGIHKLTYNEMTQWPAGIEKKEAVIGSNVVITTDEGNTVTSIQTA